MKQIVLLFLLYAIKHCVFGQYAVYNGNGVPDSVYEEKYPYVGAVIQGNGSDASQICGGVVIRDQHTLEASIWFLTASHCISEAEDDVPLSVAFESDWTKAKKRYHLNLDAKYPPQRNLPMGDIALVKFEEEPELPTSGPMLPKQALPLNTTVSIFGWGRTKTEEQSDRLQTCEVTSLATKTCQSLFDSYPFPFGQNLTLVSDEICTYHTSENCTTCVGDSGSPVLYGNTIIGIVSRGTGFCGPRNDVLAPDIHVDVFQYLDWIHSIIGKTT